MRPNRSLPARVRLPALQALCLALLLLLPLALGCRANQEISTQPRTLYEAWDLITGYVEKDGLELYGYAATSVDEAGRSQEYTLSAYDAKEDVLHVMRATPRRIRFFSLPHPQEQPTAPIERLYDSPELIAQADEQLDGTCRQGLSLGINLVEGRADTLCMAPRSGAKLSPYKD